MKEHLFLNKIINTLSNSSYIGDDCAILDDLGIALTQDTLVEDVHFALEYTNAYKLGYKSVIVNISDILAAGAKPQYLSISMSLPNKINEVFIEDFYKAVDDLSKRFDFEVVGGDITGADKLTISICAIGDIKNRNVSSRKNARVGDLIVVTGKHGLSSYGLYQLKCGIKQSEYIDEHLMPTVDDRFSEEISKKVKRYAMMDTSDGIVDALFKIAQNSDVTLTVDYDKIPKEKGIDKNFVLYGGEDYKLAASLNREDLDKISKDLYTVIGYVEEKQNCPLKIKFDNYVEDIKNLDRTFNHFEGI